MKKRAASLFLVVSMSFTLFYPNLALNDNVCVLEEGYDEEEMGISLTELLKASRSDKKFRIKLLELIYELCQ